ncbi:hypothetical protein UCRPA7_4136 [Phaeoacremonium minimum UCRPA7]|uniref:Transcription factor BYE1 n=1 Tax=Phaeoacremonium minimum (strain UCR-PA7) TaxID=1286976 RepID=R8BM22_PHAM7|nr:hypothetical protein UCRPA7_4136 [Phaeoacremonium minimum UCRPA7]EOO00377.1 hypothetical protein UCRPA7_4136 [Phaeoacremonium minimum UCRPA7]
MIAGEPEPRRSVRSTKGQHKALDQLETPAVDTKKRGKKGKKAIEKTEEPEEEIIRCVCGATEQDEDSGEPWIACDKCGAWQHNVCMGMSVYSEDLPSDYFCEQCKPEDHKELLEGIAKGEKPWEARRRAYEEEQAEKKKKKGSKKGKKRQSDSQDEPQSSQKSKASPAPEKKAMTSKILTAGTKRKDRDGSQDKDAKATPKMRKVSETKVMPVPPPYNPPDDLPDKITELPQPRQGPAQALMKSLVVAVNSAEKKKVYSPADGVSNESRAERLSIAIERAVHDTHPNHKEYTAQVRTLTFNLKKNQELCERLLNHTLTPPMLAAMTTEELASEDLQRETAEMKARAEKQSILITEEGPRMRRTHKGDEMVADDNFAIPSDETPSVARRPSVREPLGDLARPSESDQSRDAAAPTVDTTQRSTSGDAMQIDTQHSPSANNFDIKKVFSSVKSPTAGHNRRPSAPAPLSGPGDDPDVDRLLEEDGNDSPPYSPSEETDPDVVWRGYLTMPSVANFQATAKYAGGANLARTIGLPWSTLIPKRLKVAGRISEENATEYLCGLRYSAPTDIVVASLTPATDASKADFDALVNYFVSKKRR